ncbi:hypothetical protein DSO57_1032159 [Entomophthora muscae]|uniref:Uncharacterized protein n=1 Tax=Entomophthora muscae TaxID=34485 RepID=A0ACC2TYR8_9FUNG|nr:hypothetical protein DSO57_1032159 [Entomophthora muscae]
MDPAQRWEEIKEIGKRNERSYEKEAQDAGKDMEGEKKEDARTRVNATYWFQCMMGTSSRKALDHLKVTRSYTAMTEVRRDNGSMATE